MPTTLVRLRISLLSRSSILFELTFLASSVGNDRNVNKTNPHSLIIYTTIMIK